MNKQANRQPGGLNSKGNIWTQEAFRAVRVCVGGGDFFQGVQLRFCVVPESPRCHFVFLLLASNTCHEETKGKEGLFWLIQSTTVGKERQRRRVLSLLTSSDLGRTGSREMTTHIQLAFCFFSLNSVQDSSPWEVAVHI